LNFFKKLVSLNQKIIRKKRIMIVVAEIHLIHVMSNFYIWEKKKEKYINSSN